MIDSKTFPRNIPKVLCRKQKIALQSMAFCVNAIQLIYSRLRNSAIACPPWAARNANSIDDRILLGMFTDCWSIIDHAHTLQQMIQYLDSTIQHLSFDLFISNHSQIRALRNRMDHLRGNIENLANLKDHRPPLHGTLSYAFVSKDVFDEKRKELNNSDVYHIVGRMYGGFIHEKHSSNIVNPVGKEWEWPTGLFQLAAFDCQVDLSGIARDARKLEEGLVGDIRNQLEQQLTEEAHRHGIEKEIIMKTDPVGFHLTLTIGSKLPNDLPQ